MATVALACLFQGVMHACLFQGVMLEQQLILRGKRVFRRVAVFLRVIRCVLCRKMAADITPLGAACQATWSTVIILGSPAFLEIMAKHVCPGFLGENIACASAVVLRIERCMLRKEMAAESTPLGAA